MRVDLQQELENLVMVIYEDEPGPRTRAEILADVESACNKVETGILELALQREGIAR